MLEEFTKYVNNYDMNDENIRLKYNHSIRVMELSHKYAQILGFNDEDIYLIFGKESTGIPREILRDYLDDTYRLPMVKEARSLNLSNCAAIGAYELLRQQGFKGLSDREVIKGEDWILK